ncbi:TatD family hydrolase [Agaribacterium sp. ZY112]|uniref:TatD family hydrolase n=1 Tax=Agaribacterium sp. ZY112 TaxID=3233574 RepID=UPI0035265DD8
MLVDSHCHLDRLKLEAYGGDLTKALDAARERDISAMLCVCISEENKQAVLDIAAQHDDIFASVGVHPSDVNARIYSVEELVEWSKAPKVVALGESGLDYYYTKDSAQVQQQSFINHLQAGAQTNLPVIVHTREAKADTLALIKEHGATDSAGVLHCFTEDWEMAEKALDLGYYISLSGIVTFKNAENLREVAKKVPLERLLVETDSPYLAPVPYRGKPNEPKFVREVAQFIADHRGISLEALAEATTENFYNLFNRAVTTSVK